MSTKRVGNKSAAKVQPRIAKATKNLNFNEQRLGSITRSKSINMSVCSVPLRRLSAEDIDDLIKKSEITTSRKFRTPTAKQPKMKKTTIPLRKLSTEEITLATTRPIREIRKPARYQTVDLAKPPGDPNKSIVSKTKRVAVAACPKVQAPIRKPIKRLGTPVKKPVSKAVREFIQNSKAKSIPENSISNSIHQRQPIYKSNSTTAMSKAPKPIADEDVSIYDYFSNSQDQSSQDEDPMKEVIERLRRENKIVLKKKQTRKKKSPDQSVNAANKPVWAEGRKKMIVKRGLRQLKENLQVVLRKEQSYSQKPTPERTESSVVDLSTDSDDDDNHPDYDDDNSVINDENVPCETIPTNYKTIDILDDTNELSIIAPPRTSAIAPVPVPASKDPPLLVNRSNKNPIVYKLSLKKPNYQSTPKLPQKRPSEMVTSTATKLVSPPNQSPWRVSDENIPRTFYFSTSNDLLPTYSSDIIVAASQPNRGSSNSLAKADVDGKTTAKRLEYGGMDRNNTKNDSGSSGSINNNEDTAPIILVDTINLSNIENVEPDNHTAVQAKLAKTTTKIVLETQTAGARSPLKALAIKNVLLSPQHQTEESVDVNEEVSVSITQLGSELINVTDDTDPLAIDTSKPNQQEAAFNESIAASTSNNAPCVSNYFGFDSYMNDDDQEYDDNVTAKSTLTTAASRSKAKLLTLSRCLPPIQPRAPRIQPTRARTRTLFGNDNNGGKQQNIEVAMKNKKLLARHFRPDTPTIDLDEQQNISASSSRPNTSTDPFESVLMTNTIGDDTPILFETLWPEAEKRKSYTRIPKRKRNISFSYTDDEDDEDEQENKKRKKTNQYAKRKEQEKKAAAKELDVFANEFNSMCEEVDQYELAVERSS